jgi:hypothetical protein
MMRRPLLFVGFLVWAASASGCGPRIDLSKHLAVTDVFTGWYDDGMHDGLNRLVPTISFKLKNTGPAAFAAVQLTVSFWLEGADGEWDSAQVRGIGSEALAVGDSTDPILVRASVGYTIEAPGGETFSNTHFKDASAKIFARRGGVIVQLGEFKLDRRILPHVAKDAPRP